MSWNQSNPIKKRSMPMRKSTACDPFRDPNLFCPLLNIILSMNPRESSCIISVDIPYLQLGTALLFTQSQKSLVEDIFPLVYNRLTRDMDLPFHAHAHLEELKKGSLSFWMMDLKDNTLMIKFHALKNYTNHSACLAIQMIRKKDYMTPTLSENTALPPFPQYESMNSVPCHAPHSATSMPSSKDSIERQNQLEDLEMRLGRLSIQLDSHFQLAQETLREVETLKMEKIKEHYRVRIQL